MGSGDEIMPHKDKEAARQYKADYRQKNLEAVRAYARKSANKNRDKRRSYWNVYSVDPENKAKIKAYRIQYESRPEVKEQKSLRGKQDYQRNKDKVLARQAARRRERLSVINSVALHYGCSNPACQWQGLLEAYQLDFHHFDPSTKLVEVAKLESASYDRIKAEINKCIVLCKNCHCQVHHGDLQVTPSMMCNVSIANGNDVSVLVNGEEIGKVAKYNV